MPFAHSPDSKRQIPAQDYAAHIGGVIDRACAAAERAAKYAALDGECLKKTVGLAAEFHDLGKLDEDNQDVLSGRRKARKLPVQHTDAGTAYLLDSIHMTPGAVLVRSHHLGLPDFVEESNRNEESLFRDDAVRERVNRVLSELIKAHEEAFLPGRTLSQVECEVRGDAFHFFSNRSFLSCRWRPCGYCRSLWRSDRFRADHRSASGRPVNWHWIGM